MQSARDTVVIWL